MWTFLDWMCFQLDDLIFFFIPVNPIYRFLEELSPPGRRLLSAQKLGFWQMIA